MTCFQALRDKQVIMSAFNEELAPLSRRLQGREQLVDYRTLRETSPSMHDAS